MIVSERVATVGRHRGRIPGAWGSRRRELHGSTRPRRDSLIIRRRLWPARMRGLLALSRPLNCLMSAAGVLIGTVAAGGVAAWSSVPVSVGLAALASFATAGREVTKDIQDMKGDVDRRTLPQRVGAANAGFAAAGFLVVAVGLSLFPAYFGVLGLGYLVVVLLADGMFIYAALHSAANPSRSQRVTKYAMIVALAAFLAGAFV